MKVEKTISDSGHITIKIDGVELVGKNIDEISQKLTGAVGQGNGVFSKDIYCVFFFGDFKNELCLNNTLDNRYEIEEYAARLIERIKIVRDWVESCKRTAGTAYIVL